MFSYCVLDVLLRCVCRVVVSLLLLCFFFIIFNLFFYIKKILSGILFPEVFCLFAFVAVGADVFLGGASPPPLPCFIFFFFICMFLSRGILQSIALRHIRKDSAPRTYKPHYNKSLCFVQ